jgi:hypothetical protein
VGQGVSEDELVVWDVSQIAALRCVFSLVITRIAWIQHAARDSRHPRRPSASCPRCHPGRVYGSPCVNVRAKRFPCPSYRNRLSSLAGRGLWPQLTPAPARQVTDARSFVGRGHLPGRPTHSLARSLLRLFHTPAQPSSRSRTRAIPTYRTLAPYAPSRARSCVRLIAHHGPPHALCRDSCARLCLPCTTVP